MSEQLWLGQGRQVASQKIIAGKLSPIWNGPVGPKHYNPQNYNASSVGSPDPLEDICFIFFLGRGIITMAATHVHTCTCIEQAKHPYSEHSLRLN